MRRRSSACNVGDISPAAAGDVDIYLGVPTYGYRVNPPHRYYEGYRRSDPYRYPRYRGSAYDYDDGPRLSCREARRLVRSHGFYDIETRACEGRNYAFSGFRNGHYAIIYVNSRTGRVWRP